MATQPKLIRDRLITMYESQQFALHTTHLGLLVLTKYPDDGDSGSIY